MKVILYTRNSTENRPAASIAGQFRMCRLQAKEQGLTIVEEYSDQTIRGSTLILRPGVPTLAINALSSRLMTRATGDVSDLDVGLNGTMKALFLKDLEDNTRHGLIARHNDLVDKVCF
jgi:site-specific DNA recombinase